MAKYYAQYANGYTVFVRTDAEHEALWSHKRKPIAGGQVRNAGPVTVGRFIHRNLDVVDPKKVREIWL